MDTSGNNGNAVINDDYIISKMQEILGIEYSDEQKAILKTKGSLRIISCAGSGKTTTISHMIAKRLLAGEIGNVESILCTTFSKVGAGEIESKLNKILKDLGYVGSRIKVKTLHAFFLSVLNKFGVKSNLITNAQATQFIRQLCTENKVSINIYDNEDIESLKSMISYQVNNVMTCKQLLESPACKFPDMTEAQYSAIYNGFMIKKRDAKLMDYDDMQSNLYHWLVVFKQSNDPNLIKMASVIRDYCKSMYSYFYIDEAQDTSLIQFYILREIVGIEVNSEDSTYWKLDKQVVLIGDDDQAIYGWRGARPEILVDYFTTTFDMPTLTLPTNYRCGRNIVEFAGRSVKYNNYRYPKNMLAYNGDGKISIKVLKNDSYAMSEEAVKIIKKIVQSGDKLSDIAVLSRENAYLSVLANMLLREGIYNDTAPDMKLTKGRVYKDMIFVLKLMEDSINSSDMAELLYKILPFFKKENAKAITKIRDSIGLGPYDLIGAVLKYIMNTDVEFDAEQKCVIPTTLYSSIDNARAKLRGDAGEAWYKLFDVLKAYKGGRLLAADTFQNIYDLYEKGATFLYKTEGAARTHRGIGTYFCNMLRTQSAKQVLEYFKACEQLDSGNMTIPGDKVTLSTIHGAKGCEWKHVILFACDNYSMPSFQGLYGLCERNVDVTSIKRSLDEERRLFYVGCTRAKEDLAIITNTDASPFLLEALGILDDSVKNHNDEILDMAADKRVYQPYAKRFEGYLKGEGGIPYK